MKEILCWRWYMVHYKHINVYIKYLIDYFRRIKREINRLLKMRLWKNKKVSTEEKKNFSFQTIFVAISISISEFTSCTRTHHEVPINTWTLHQNLDRLSGAGSKQKLPWHEPPQLCRVYESMLDRSQEYWIWQSVFKCSSMWGQLSF